MGNGKLDDFNGIRPLEKENKISIIDSQTTERIKEIPNKIDRFFSFEGKSPFQFNTNGDPINWISEEVSVTDDRGKVIFKQPNVQRPDFWSSLAIKVVASKYFWGDQTINEREDSAEKLIGRVSRYIGRQAFKQEFFNEKDSNILRDEIAAICLNQLCVFNSPVWFNAGINEYNNEAGGVSAFIWDDKTQSVIKSIRSMDRPQCSACFILSINDNMDSIMKVQVAEANLFKAGSGTGTNRSPLRSSREKLTGGGRASGPVSFMKGYDAYAGIIKSGGKTRRAAKMEILNVDHPDIMEFINAKQNEEKKAWALIEQGFDGGMNGEAYASIAFQNCNMSVRVSDKFMECVKSDGDWWTKKVKTDENCEKFKAREILNKIAEGTWVCGDPGIQCDDTIHKYHTCKNSGRQNATNPCVTGDTKVLTQSGGWKRIDSLLGRESVILTNTGIIGESKIKGSFKTGKKPVYKLETKCGYEIKLTADHKVYTVNRGFVPAMELTKDDYVLLPGNEVCETKNVDDKTFYQMLGVYLGKGSGVSRNHLGSIQLTMSNIQDMQILENFAEYSALNYEGSTRQNYPAAILMSNTSGKFNITNTILLNKFSNMVNLKLKGHEKCISEQIFNLPLCAQKYVLQGLYTADGTVANYGDRLKYVALNSTSLQLLKDVQLILLGFGIKSSLYKNRRAGTNESLLHDWNGELNKYKIKEIHSLRISKSGRLKFEKLIGFMPESKMTGRLKKLNDEKRSYNDKPIDVVKSIKFLGVEDVYDLTEPLTNSFVANGITVHNCSEYLFLDDTACNLASINLLKFRTPDGGFAVEKFKKVVKYFITAMDVIVDGASYPTEEIARRSHIFRTLGLGYANLGALLMSWGLPYDSNEGRAVAAAITAIMGGEAYKTSAELAGMVGQFPGYKDNKDCMLDVVRMHRENVKNIDVEAIPSDLRDLVNVAWDCWTDALELGEKYGYRNAQTTLLAPTGTIAFMMDCDTTGIEPDIALVKYKVLAGGGMLKIVNKTVPLALNSLGYKEEQIKEIINYIDNNDTIENSPGLKEEHLPVFDCAFRPAKGKRAISYKGHVDMMSVTQPFLSGAISKTINMPEDSTVKNIAEAYLYAWEKKLKAIAIYRENSKRSQALNTKKTDGEMIKKGKKVLSGFTRELPQTRKSITHRFDIAGHKGYLTIGLYDDGKPGEIFVTMAKEGSTIKGLMDAWARSVSINLQYGISVNTLFSRFRHQKFEPSGFVKNVEGGAIDEKISPIRSSSSIVDYVAQFMLNNFGEGTGKVNIDYKDLEHENDTQADLTDFGNEGLTCPICGGPAKRIGNCAITCTSCLQTTRNGCGE